MKTSMIFKKSTVFVIAILMALLAAFAVVPASAEGDYPYFVDETGFVTFDTAVEEAVRTGQAITLTKDTSVSVAPYKTFTVDKAGYAFAASTEHGYSVKVLENRDGTVTVTSYKDQGERIAAMDVALSGTIAMRFYFTDLGVLKTNSNAYMKVTIPQRKGDPDKVINVRFGDFTVDAKGRYVLTVKIAAAQQTDMVRFQVVNGNQVGRVRQYAFKDYSEMVLDSPEKYEKSVAPVKALLNYGALAQTLFEHNDNDLANKDIYHESNPVEAIEQIYETLNDVVPENKTERLIAKGFDAELDSDTGLKFFFVAENLDIARAKATIESMGGRVQIKGNKIKITEETIEVNGVHTPVWQVAINNIPAYALDANFKVTVTVDDGEHSASVVASTLHYIEKVLGDANSTEQQKNAVKALYQYYIMMKELRGENIENKPETCEHEKTHKEITKTATCVTEGSCNIVCSLCNVSVGTDTIAAGSVHENVVSRPAMAASCTVSGWEAYKECLACGTLLQDNETDALDAIVEVPKLAHTYDNWSAPQFVNGEWVESTTCTTCAENANTITRPVAFVMQLSVNGVEIASDNTTAYTVYDFKEVGAAKTLELSGYVAVNGGVSKYVYSVDGGEWQEVTGVPGNESFADVPADIGKLGLVDYETNSDVDELALSPESYDAMSIVIAAVPVSNEEAIIPIACIYNVPANLCEHEYGYTSNGDGTHTAFCTKCEEETELLCVESKDIVYNAYEKIYQSVCSFCGATCENKGQFNYFWGPEELFALGAASGSVALSDDGTYVTYVQADDATETTTPWLFNEVNVAEYETGNYLVLMYRFNLNTTTEPFTQIFANSTSLNSDSFNLFPVKEGWNLVVVDLSERSFFGYTDADAKTYTANVLRVDVLSDVVDGEESVDYKFIALCDDLRAVEDYVEANEDLKEACVHGYYKSGVSSDGDYEKHQADCVACGERFTVYHKWISTVNSDSVVWTCDCGMSVIQNINVSSADFSLDARRIYNTGSGTYPKNHTNCDAKLISDGDEMFTRINCIAELRPNCNLWGVSVPDYGALPTDPTGQYMLIKYRALALEGQSATAGCNIWAGTGKYDAPGACKLTDTASPACNNTFAVNYGNEWNIVLIDLSTGDYVSADEEGKYNVNFIRIDPPMNCVMDFAWVAFFDNRGDVSGFITETVTEKHAHVASESVDITATSGAPYLTHDIYCVLCKQTVAVPHSWTATATATKYAWECADCGQTNEQNVNTSAAKLFFDANYIAVRSMQNTPVVTVDGENGEVYAHINKTAGIVYFEVFSNAEINAWGKPETGNYLVVKYRTDCTGTACESADPTTKYFNVWSYTEGMTAATGASGYGRNCAPAVIHNSEWKVVVIDLSGHAKFNAAADNKYYANFIRLDIFGGDAMHSDMDIAWIATFDSYNSISAFVVENSESPAECQEHKWKDMVPTTDAEFATHTATCYICNTTQNSAHVWNANATDAGVEWTCSKCALTTTQTDIDPTAANLFFDASDLYGTGVWNSPDNLTGRLYGYPDGSLIVENGEAYISVTGGTNVYIYYDKSTMPGTPTGQYALIKYRTVVPENVTINDARIWAGTGSILAPGGTYGYSGADMGFATSHNNGWNIQFVDLSKGTKVTPNQDGSYTLNFFRIDQWGQSGPVPANGRFEMAYIAFFDSIEKIDDFIVGSSADSHECIYGYGESVDCEKHERVCYICGETNEFYHVWNEGVYGAYTVNERSVSGYKYTCTDCPESRVQEMTDKANVLMGPAKMVSAIYNNTLSGQMMSDRENVFARFTNPGGNAYLSNVYVASGTSNADWAVTGQYLVFKYRTHDAAGATPWFSLWTTTDEQKAVGGMPTASIYLEDDDQWHVMVIDLAEYFTNYVGNGTRFVKSSDGQYRAGFLRVVFWQGTTDLAYLAFVDDLSEACGLDPDFEMWGLTGDELQAAIGGDVAEDKSYVRYTGTAVDGITEVSVPFTAGNPPPLYNTGKVVALVYRVPSRDYDGNLLPEVSGVVGMELFNSNTKVHQGNSKGSDKAVMYNGTNKWGVLYFDFTNNNKSSATYSGWMRLDIINSAASTGDVSCTYDIAAIQGFIDMNAAKAWADALIDELTVECAEHNWVKAPTVGAEAETHDVYCTVCGLDQGRNAHEWQGVPTVGAEFESHSACCLVCGYETDGAVAHSWTSQITANGLVWSCTGCSQTTTQTIDSSASLKMFTASDIVNSFAAGFSTLKVGKDEVWAEINETSGNSRAYFISTGAGNCGVESGQYLILKYKVNYTDTSRTQHAFAIWAGSGEYFKMGGNIPSSRSYTMTKADGWQIAVIDLATLCSGHFSKDANKGTYCINTFAIDPWGQAGASPALGTISLAYMALTNSLASVDNFIIGSDTVSGHNHTYIGTPTTGAEYNSHNLVCVICGVDNGTEAHTWSSTPTANGLVWSCASCGQTTTQAVNTDASLKLFTASDISKITFESNYTPKLVVENGEAYAEITTTTNSVRGVFINEGKVNCGKETGKYLIFKYKVSYTDETRTNHDFVMWAGAGDTYYKMGGGNIPSANVAIKMTESDDWQIVVIDLSTSNYFTSEASGKYCTNVFSIDPWGQAGGGSVSLGTIKLAYVAFTNSFDNVKSFVKNATVQCQHVFGNYAYVGATEQGYLTEASICRICGAAGETREAYRVINSDQIFVDAQSNYTMTGNRVVTNDTTTYTLPEGTIVSSAVKIYGWMGGANGEMTKGYYRIFGSDGTVVKGWTLCETVGEVENKIWTTTDSGIVGSLNTNYPYFGNVTEAKRFNIVAALTDAEGNKLIGNDYKVEFVLGLAEQPTDSKGAVINGYIKGVCIDNIDMAAE